MKQIYKFFLTLLFVITCLGSFAQGQPDWVKGTGFKALPRSIVVVRSAVAPTEEMAQNLAMEKVRQEADSRNFTIVDKFSTKTGNEWTVYLLAQIARIYGTSIGEPLTKTNSYKLVGESFVPGMAQIKKGQTGKGVAFIAAEAVCVGGIIFSESQRSSFVSKIKDTRNPALMKDYKNKSNTWLTARNVFIGGAVAFYVWNVIDGIVAKGKTQIVGPKGERIAFSPYYSPESFNSPESFGLSLNVTW